MLETVFSSSLPTGERLLLRKNRIRGRGGPGPRITVVTGMHGDGYEGQLVAYELARRLSDREGALRGVVDIYPALNPLGMSVTTRGMPLFDLDLDRTFPGDAKGNTNEALAAAIVADIRGANACVDIRSPDEQLREVSYVRIDEGFKKRLLPLAQVLNTQLIWVHKPTLAERTSLSHTLNSLRTRTLTVWMGESLRITESFGSWVTEGILRLIELMGGWTATSVSLPDARIISDEDVSDVAVGASGMFLPRSEHGTHVEDGQPLGIVVDPQAAKVVFEVRSPTSGLLMSLRSRPVVYPGSLVARVLGGVR